MNKRNMFYYDESFHTRIITKGYLDDNFNSDSYIGASVGWNASNDNKIRNEYKIFEEKFKNFYGVNELKSQVIKSKFYEFGLASFKRDQIDFYTEYFSILEKGIYIYLCVLSKLELVIRQIVAPYHGYDSQEGQSLLYIVTKAIWLYRPEKVINALFSENDDFIFELKSFLKIKIGEIINIEHKTSEIHAFRQCLQLLNNNLKLHIDFSWNYEIAFWGLKLLIEELHMNENRLSLVLDREGNDYSESKTLIAARKAGFSKAIELDSTNELGVRMADLLCGFTGRIIRSMKEAYRYRGDEFKRIKLLDSRWFQINEEQFYLYKKIANLFFKLNNNHYMSYAGVYGDDISSFFILFTYFDEYSSIDDYSKFNSNLHAEHFNDLSCHKLRQDFQRFGKSDTYNI